ncbi:uroporphyrinogen-III C-methyltransferase [Roseospirillum parvum]|uniref:uroporphyrinogen-III C-methyltransferase n=1 Tax=Roseospirillum parvum TaxID=83401 RepID=A0A1G7WV71_9PROT|nr:uroporphyrinogen-III C-methyltransferase [Roseospirillum parvum]SDG75776.1 uroporphyrin-III C-methyltransferase [Roseospirillum parvum]
MPDPHSLLPPLPQLDAGSVWLVGAGPGDPGLLTRLAVHALASCDVVVHDALIDPVVLTLAGDAERIDIGKRGGRASPSQETVSALLIEQARAGRRVCRLKGGDPFVFGRGPDEALALAEANITFRVVPGISAGLAGPAYAGVPLTVGGPVGAVALISGQGPGGGLPQGLDLAALAKGAPTLVLFMAMRVLPEITARLLAAGRDPAEPAVVVRHATWASQRRLLTTLGRLAEDVAAAGLSSPAVVVIGPTAGLAERLDWFRPDADPT